MVIAPSVQRAVFGFMLKERDTQTKVTDRLSQTQKLDG